MTEPDEGRSSQNSQTEVPDSATTARDSLFRDVLLTSDGSLRKEKDIDDLEIDPLDRELTRKSLAPTEKDYDEDRNDAGGFGGDGALEKKVSHAVEWWKFRLRPAVDDEPEDWWFASTAIPLLAATLGPMANVLSMAALITSWRETYSDAAPGVDEDAVGYADPGWCLALNGASLACGFLGNFFLLFNFTRAVRYIIALPLTIILWFIATGILMAITICMHLYDPPPDVNGLYSQGYWHAVMAACLYFICSLMLMINMLGYCLGHYPQNFELDDEQRNLILQTMMLFFWLAAGAGIFSRVCEWSFPDALYFCDVTILTVGFGDFFPHDNLGRGLIFPYAVGGIIILGLVVSSIARFAQQLGHDKVVRKHLDKRRLKTLSKTVSSSEEAEEHARLDAVIKENAHGVRPNISAPFNPTKRTIAFQPPDTPELGTLKSPKSFKSAYSRASTLASPKSTLSWASSISDRITHPSRHTHHSAVSRGIKRMGTLRRVTTKNTKLLLLREERDRFNAMRRIQYKTKRFKKWVGLTMSLLAFLIVWCLGALVFAEAEDKEYFESLYFCYVSLLTIGYGDESPKSNPGKPFFVVWSLMAIPTMTILISSMGDTIVASYKQGTFHFADFTVLPKQGYVRAVIDKYPGFFGWIVGWIEVKKQKSRLEKGFPVGPEQEEEQDQEQSGNGRTLEQLAEEQALDEHDLARSLTAAIRDTADDLKHGNFRRYNYEEWVEFSRLIRFTKYKKSRKYSVSNQLDEEEQDEGIIEWDWIGDDSPMMADQSETEWVLDRLCESLERYMQKQVPELKRRRRQSDTLRTGGYHDRQQRAAADVGFSPVALHHPHHDGPRRRNNSVRGKVRTPLGSPHSPSLTLHPTDAPGPGARTPPIPGAPPSQDLPRSSLDGSEDVSDQSYDSDSRASLNSNNDNDNDINSDIRTPRPFKPRPAPRPHNLDVFSSRPSPLLSPPTVSEGKADPMDEIFEEEDDDAEDGEITERETSASRSRTPRGRSHGSGRPSLATAVVGQSGSSHGSGSRTRTSWYQRRQTLAGVHGNGSGYGGQGRTGGQGGGGRRRSQSSRGEGMTSLTAMRLKQR